MPYRELDENEVRRILVQRKNADAYQRFLSHARTYYGDTVASVAVNVVSHDNDEFFVPGIGLVDVRDRNNHALLPLRDRALLLPLTGSYLTGLYLGAPDGDESSAFEDLAATIEQAIWKDSALPDGLDLATDDEDEEPYVFNVDRPQDWQPRPLYVSDPD